MSIYTQDNSDIQIIVDGKNDKDELGNDLVLLAEILEGSFEALSEPFCIELKLLSPAAVPPLDMKEMLGRNATVKLKNSLGTWRYFNGMLEQFGFDGYYNYENKHHGNKLNEDLFQYRVTLRPRVSLLKNSRKNRVFHNQSPRVIMRNILNAWQIEHQDCLSNSNKDTEKYYNFEQCVQYQESDFNFISRLMEADGVFYSFWQGEDINKGPIHKMLLHDKNPAVGLHLNFNQKGDNDAVNKFELSEKIVPAFVRLDDYDFRQADVTFFDHDDSKVNQKTDLGSYSKNMLINDFEADFSVMKVKSDVSKYREKLKAVSAQRFRVEQYEWKGETKNRQIAAGMAFSLEGFPTGNIKGLVTRVEFKAKTAPYSTAGASMHSDSNASFSASFKAQDLNIPFRPRIAARRPKIDSVVSARVITVENIPEAYTGNGKAAAEKSNAGLSKFGADLGGDPVGIDKKTYRVKIIFNWRNTKQNSSPDTGSMWLNARFGQLWADSGSGKFEIPRKGQEVLVSFVNGNPCRPIVVGSVYNSVVSPPIDVTDANGIYGSLMRASSIKNDSEEGLLVPESLENKMPIPMSVYDLGKKENQKKYSQISLFAMENGKFKEPEIRDDTFMTKCFFPAGEPSIQQLVEDCEAIHKKNSGGGSSGPSTPMFFEGINMYSNKDVLNQAAQSQFINAGKDIRISAAGSITLQVGRSQISIKDNGVSLKTSFSGAAMNAGYVEDYRDVDDSPPSEPKFNISTFSSSLSLGPGTAGFSSPNVMIQGCYTAAMKTWFGAKTSADIASSGVKGMSTSVSGGTSLKSMIGDILGLVGKLSGALKEYSQGDADTIGLDVMGSIPALYGQLMMTYGIFMNVVNTVKQVKNTFQLKSSAISLKYNNMKKSSEKITLDAPKIDVNGNAVGAYLGLADEAASAVPVGLDTIVNALSGFGAFTRQTVDVAEVNTTAISQSDIQADKKKASMSDDGGKVSGTKISGSDNETAAADTDLHVSSSENAIQASDQSVSSNKMVVSGANVGALKNDVGALKTAARSVSTQTDGINVQ
ncbi:MAG: type VI secretion system tip protein VgrG [Lentisphaerae bacterium]|nr:type VI secretion system tip protein VgrG [Lentisphaerota bacterium]MCP4101029.1 type VI secretion system tip protein VgrG [Lentisphaerota bacterium]